MRRARAKAARGTTFIEVVGATAMMAVVATALFGVLSFITAEQTRAARILGAAEVANRVMILYLDDATAVPKQPALIGYGPATYRWNYTDEPIRLIEAGAASRVKSGIRPLSNDRYRRVTVRVWLSEESGGAVAPNGIAPEVTLTRMMDPFAIRNADSFTNLVNNPEARQRWIEQMSGMSSGASGGTGKSDKASPRRGPSTRGGGR